MVLLGGLTFVLCVVPGAAAVWMAQQVAARDARIAVLAPELERLRALERVFDDERTVLMDQLVLVEQERDRARADLAHERTRLADLEREVVETMVPREILSAADFPVERAMARGGETLEAFALRERTTVPVLTALNPWLKTGSTLSAYQTLWVPRTPRK